MRPICAGCARPLSVCLCDVIPSPPLNLQTRLLILQHPHERRHKLATVPVLSGCVHPCHVIVDRRLNSSNWPFAPPDDTDAGRRHHTLLLFPGPDATELKSWREAVADREEAAPVRVEEDASPREGLKVIEDGGGRDDTNGIVDAQASSFRVTLVVVDGTWEHAQEMVKASLPFLFESVAQVCLPFGVRSEGCGVGESDLIIRKEPFGGCVSTMEAVACALAILEPDGHILESKLMDVLRKMVSLQASHFSSPKVRPKLKKTKPKGTCYRPTIAIGLHVNWGEFQGRSSKIIIYRAGCAVLLYKVPTCAQTTSISARFYCFVGLDRRKIHWSGFH